MSDDLIKRLEALKDEVMTLEYLDALWVTSEDYVKAAAALAEAQAEVERLRSVLTQVRECFKGVLGAEMQDTERRDQGLDLIDSALRPHAETKGDG